MNEEYMIQTAFVYWFRHNYPTLLLTIAPSGMKLPISVATKFKKMGYSRGTPDVMILEPKIGKNEAGTEVLFSGLFIEFKSKRGRLTPEQVIWLGALEARGYIVHVCRTCEDAIIAVEKYLTNK